MQSDDGELFDVEIPAFSLDMPGLIRTPELTQLC